MLKFFRKSKLFTLFIIFTVVPSIIFSEQINIPKIYDDNGNICRELFNEDGVLSYAAIEVLFKKIEKGKARYDEENWYKINQFIAYLANQGVAQDENKDVLEQDIAALLNTCDDIYGPRIACYESDSYKIIPAIFYGKKDAFLCKSSSKSISSHISKFFKKHKKAIIIGAVVVVATVVVVTTIAVISSTSAATAATGALAHKNNHLRNKNHSQKIPSVQDIVPPLQDVKQAFENQISDYKKVIAENDFLFLNSIGKNSVEPIIFAFSLFFPIGFRNKKSFSAITFL